jgi:ornithine cyclodeaminase/alanine dehydrogenase-like protein (mu-crystallin family)
VTVGDLKGMNATPMLLGEVLQDVSLLPSNRDCTMYKAVGTAIQDIMTGNYIVQRAKELGIGQHVDMA